MNELLTAAQMRAIEAAAIASGEVTGLELMERAGRGVVEAIFEEWPELAKTSHRAVVLCGPGGNGGDGFVVARLLKEWGWEVEVFLYGTPEKMPPDARVNYERWVGLGEVGVLSDYVQRYAWGCDLLIDALFGIGLTRALPDLGELFWNMDDMVDCFDIEFGHSRGRPAIVAVDVPSGLCADSGRDFPHEDTHNRFAAMAHLTVTFQSAKLGHFLEDGPAQCGRIFVKDICVGHHPSKGAGGHKATCELTSPLHRAWLGKADHGYKYSHGHALILSGPPGKGGAARLAARGALRIGAGLVTVACPPDAIPENAARLDAVMLRAVGDAAGLVEVLGDTRINALCLGPGLGLDARAVGLVAAALGVPAAGSPPPPAPPHAGEGRQQALDDQNAEKARPQAAPLPQGGEGSGLVAAALGVPVPGSTRDLASGGSAAGEGGPGTGPGRDQGGRKLVLDADALTILSKHPDLFAALHLTCVLTPHAGEFARLFPDIAAKLNAPATTGPAYSKVDATRDAAARAGCVVLFKGPDTVIADPSGRCSINSAHYDRAAPWLATAGSGDVLAGFITGLLARGFAPMQAAETAAWLHVECARSFGPGLIAEDLPEELPKVFRALGL